MRQQRQRDDENQRELPVRPKEITEQRQHGQPFAEKNLDGVGGRRRHHRGVISEPRDQMAGVVFVVKARGQVQKTFKQRAAQVVDNAVSDARDGVVTQKRARALPDGNHRHHDGHGVHEVEAVQPGDAGVDAVALGGQTVEKMLEHTGEQRLGNGRRAEADDRQHKRAHIRAQVTQQALPGLDGGGRELFGHAHAKPTRHPDARDPCESHAARRARRATPARDGCGRAPEW